MNSILKVRKHYIMAIAIMFVVISLSDTTYSLFFRAETTDDFTYNTGILDLQFVEDEQINIQNAFPIVDSEGLKTKPYTLTIKNTGSLPYTFDLKMLSTTNENLIDMKYIKYQVNNSKTNTLFATNNVIASNVLLYPEEEITFNIKVWLDINTPNNQLGKTFMAKLVTSGEAIYRTLDNSGANPPELKEDMIPVYYDEITKNWKKADKSNIIEEYGWYDYDNQKWANIVNIKSTNKQIYDITRNNNIKLNEAKTNNGNYITDEGYLDIGLSQYKYNNITNIFRIKFNDLTYEKIYIISNNRMSFYYDTEISKFIFKIDDKIVSSSEYEIKNREWYIIGWTYNKNNINFYVNGNKISSGNINESIESTESFKIGTDSTYKELSNIEVGDIYIYNNILTDKEINTNYSTTINLIYDNLIAGYNNFEPKTLKEYYLSEDLGSTINNEDIASFYVWIPRYKYKLWNVTGTPGIDSYDAYGKGIDIVFENQTETSGVIRCQNNVCYNDSLLITRVTNDDNNKYYTHPAFTTGEKEHRGLWVSKYEISTSSQECTNDSITGCISNSLDIESKQGNNVWRNNYLSNFYQNIKKLDNNNNYHVIKNTEWGAITYLTHSKYGLCNNDICKTIGSNKTYISGNELTDSSTYNIYGIYDLSGSATEFVMANHTTDSNLTMNTTPFEGITINPEDIDIYKDDMFILGDATKEVSLEENSWYNNYGSFINETNNWFIRGGIGTTDMTGIFYYNGTTDTNNENITTRIVLK